MSRARDVLVVGGILLVFMAIADWRFRHPGPSKWLASDVNDHLGAEYDEIARAIRGGRGFADPFCEPSGPTAWMAPVLPYIQAGLYWVTGDDRELVIELVLVIKYLVLLLTGAIIARESRRLGRVWLGYGVFVVGLAAHFHGMFQRTHDEWLLLLVVDGLWLGIVQWWAGPASLLKAALWGGFGGFAALCSPVAGATWAVLTMIRWMPRGFKRSLSFHEGLRKGAPLLVAALCSITVVLPWTVRNRVMLGAWIPIKSNAVYEAWQSQCLDDDGALDAKTFARHPWQRPGPQRKEYLEAGELDFVASKWPELRRSVLKDPLGFCDRVANRFLVATLWYQPSSHEKRRPSWIVALKRAIFLMPFASVVLVLCLRRQPLEKQVLATALIYGVFLLPYVVISYYERYALPLVGIKMLLVMYGLDTLLRRMSSLFGAKAVKTGD